MTQKSKNTKQKRGFKSWIIVAMWTLVFVALAALSSLFIMARYEILGPMPSFEELENPKTNLATQIYSEDGIVLGTYFIENRTYLSF